MNPIIVLDHETDQLINNLTMEHVSNLYEIADFRGSLLETVGNLQITEEERNILRRVNDMKEDGMLWQSLSNALDPTLLLFSGSSKSSKLQMGFMLLLTAARTSVEYKSAQNEQNIGELQSLWELRKKDMNDYIQLRKKALDLEYNLFHKYGLKEQVRLTEKNARQSQPASATLQNIFEKDLLRCQEIELFPRPCVDFLPDFGNFPFCDGADVRPLWYILPYQLVGVFYCPLLPRAIGIGKIHRYVQFLGYPFVLRELAAVVRGYGLQGLPFVRQEQPPHGFRHRPGLLPMLEFLHEQEVRAPFRQRQYGVAVPVHDEVHLPISETPAVRLRRTLVYAYAVTDVRSLGLMSA